MAPFHLPTSFKAFTRGAKQDPVPSSPDSFHSPIARLDEWHPPAWPSELADVDGAPILGRTVTTQPPNGDKSSTNTPPRRNAETLRDFVPAPFGSTPPARQVSKSAGSRSEMLGRGQTASELRRPSTSHAVRSPSETRTHVKGGSSLSRLNAPPGSGLQYPAPFNVADPSYVPVRRPPPPPIQIHPFFNPPAQNPSFQRSDSLPAAAGDIKSQTPAEKALSKSAIPPGIATRARSNSASVAGSVGYRAPAPAPLKRTWEDISSRPSKSDGVTSSDVRPVGAPPLDPSVSGKAPFANPDTGITSRVAYRSASSPSLTQSANLSRKPSIPGADKAASAAAPGHQHGILRGVPLDRKLTLGSFRRKHAQVAVPLSPVVSEDGKSISRKSDGKPSLDVPPEPYIPRSGDLIMSPAFILAGPESTSNINGITSTLFPDGYSLAPVFAGPRMSSDSGVEVPPHVVKPGGMIRQDSATLPPEFHFTPRLPREPHVQSQNDPSGSGNNGMEASAQQPDKSATEGYPVDRHGTTATETSVVVPTANTPPAPTTAPISRPTSPQGRDALDLTHSSPSSPSFFKESNVNQGTTVTLKTAGLSLRRSSSDASLHGSLSRTSSQVSGTLSGGRTSPLRKTLPTVTAGSSSILSGGGRLRERLFDSTKRLLTGSRVENVNLSPQNSASTNNMDTGWRRGSASSSAVDVQGRNVPKILLELGLPPAMTSPASAASVTGLNASLVVPSASSSSASEYSPAPVRTALPRKQSAPLPCTSDRLLRGSSSYTNLPFTSSNRQSTLARNSSARSRSASDGSRTPATAVIIQCYTQPSPANRPFSPIGESEGTVDDNVTPSGSPAKPAVISRSHNTPSTGGFTSSSTSPRERAPTRLRRKRSHKSARAVSKAIAAAAASSPCPTKVNGAVLCPQSPKNVRPFPQDTKAPANVTAQTSQPTSGSLVMSKTALSIPRPNARPGLPAGPRVRPTASLRVNGVRLGSEPSLHLSSPAPRSTADNTASTSAVRPKIDTTNVLQEVPMADGADSPASPCFRTVPVRWKGMTLDRAKWTFTSQELQAMVGRAIKQSSAEVTAIRLLSPQALDVEMPEEVDRLETERDEIKARYGHQIRLRKLLMRSLDLYIDGSDPETARRLLNDLRDVSALCETLGQQLHVVTDQLAQIHALHDQHLSSALIMALHKLNAGFLRASSEADDLKSQLAKAQAESEDGWDKALELERELDSLRSQPETSLEGSVADDTMSAKGSGGRISRVSQARQSSARVSKASLRQYSKGSARSSTHSLRFASLVFPRPPSIFPPYSYTSTSPPPPVPNLPVDFGSPSFGHHYRKSLHRESTTSRLAVPVTALSTPSSAALALVQAQNEVLEMLGLSAIDIDGMPRHRRSHSQPIARLSCSASSAEDSPAEAPARPTSLLVPLSPAVRRRMSDSFVKDCRTSTFAAALQTDDYIRSNNLFRTMVSQVDTVDS